MVRQDDRTPEQKKTHKWGIVAKDKCLSGWGGARGGASRCAWAFDNLDYEQYILKWVESRSDMSYINFVNLNEYRPARGTAHYHIYVVDIDHPALERYRFFNPVANK